MMWTEAAVMPWVLSIRSAWTLCEQEEMTLLTCSRRDRVLVTVTPRMLMTSTRLMLARGSGFWKRGFRRLSVITISWDLARLRVKLASILWSHNEETRELRGERDNARNSARCTQARKTTHGLDGQHQDVDRTLRGRVSQNDKGQG